MRPLTEEVKDLLSKITGLKYEIKQLPSSLDEPVWDVTMEYHTALVMPPYEAHEAIHSVWGYSNGDIVFLPKMKNILKILAETLDHKQIGSFLLGYREKWNEAEKEFPNSIAFLRKMEKIANEINSQYGSDVELYLDQEDEEWWLQACFNSKKLSQKEILQRVERNIKGLLEALKEYHEALSRRSQRC
jgi:hypothetical protein